MESAAYQNKCCITSPCCICYLNYVKLAAKKFSFYCMFALVLPSSLSVIYNIRHILFSKQINFKIFMFPDKNEATNFLAL